MIPFNEAVLRTFENAPDEDSKRKKDIFFYPLKTHKQARAFARAIQRNGLTFEQLCKELNETVGNFKLWEFKKGAPLVGTCLMDKVNSYIETVFVCTDDKYCKSVKLEEPAKLKEDNKIQNFDEKCKKNVNHIVSEPKFDVAEIKIEVSIKHLRNKEVPPSSKREMISNKYSNETKTFVEKSHDLKFVSPQKALMSNSDADQLSFVDSASLQKVGFSKKQAAKNNSRIQVLIDKFNRLSRKEVTNNSGFEKRDLCISKESTSQFEKKSLQFVDKLSMHHFNSHKGENVFSLISNDDGCKAIYNQVEDENNKIFVSSEQVDLSHERVERAFSNHDAKGAVRDIRPQLRISTFSFNKEIPSRRIYPESSANVENVFKCFDKKSMTDVEPLSKVFNQFTPTNNNCYKIAQNKELKDNTNLQIKANLGLKFGISVASIISKFNKLQERN